MHEFHGWRGSGDSPGAVFHGEETSGTPVGGGNSVAIAFQTTDRQTNKQIDIAVA